MPTRRAFVLLTPAGRISRYFYGIEFPARELKYALIEASASKIGSPIDKLLMYCYDYDPATGKYTFAVMTVIRVLGVATALALGTFMFVMVRRDRRMARATRASTPNFLQDQRSLNHVGLSSISRSAPPPSRGGSTTSSSC